MIENSNTVARLLVVSRDCAVLRAVWSVGEANNWRLEIGASVWEAMDKLQTGATPDLLLVDLPPEDADGLQVLRWMRRLRPALPVILIDRAGDAARKQESLRMGARDYLITPLEDRQLEAAIQRNLSVACETAAADVTSDDVEPVGNNRFFIAASAVMRKLRSQLDLLAGTDAPVLISGEPGSGKETVARLLHKLSVRSGFEFAKVNCAALPGELLEREIFGYKGVTLDASPGIRRGKLEFCARGTILLDEITEMPLGLQANLLQVLQSGRFVRPGASDSIEVDVRILAASSKSLEQAVADRRVHADLYRLLSAYEIQVPPLRERREEISFLSRHFMHRLARHYGLPPREFSPAIGKAWQAREWPGNLRELERSVKRYLVVGDMDLGFDSGAFDSEGNPGDFTSAMLRGASQTLSSSRTSPAGVLGSKSLRSLLKSVKAEAERNAIAMALEKTGWNRKAAARLLKVSYRTVLYKIEEYQMNSSHNSLLPASDPRWSAMAGFPGNGHAGAPKGDLSQISDDRGSEG